MDVNDVDLFLAIVETNSITSAAEMLHFSQSTVSYRLKKMEKELGTPLFYRDKGNRAELTSHGEHFVDIAKRWQAVWLDTQSLKLLPAHALVVATIDSVSSTILPDVYKEVTSGDAPLKLRIMTHQSGEIYDLVENQIADIGFVSIEHQRKNVDTIAKFSQKYYVIRYSPHPTTPRKVKPSELDPALEIHNNWGGNYEQWHEDLWGPLTKYHVWLDTISLLPSFLTEEKYWTILQETSLPQLLSTFRTVQIDELDLPVQQYRTCYIIKHNRPKPSSEEGLAIFERALRKKLNDLKEKQVIF